MALLDIFGLGRKKPRPVGQTLEKGRTNERQEGRRHWLIKILIFLALVLLTLAAFPRGNVFEQIVQTGDEWRQETIVAPFDFAIYKDDETLDAERQEVRVTTPPFFREVPGVMSRITENRDMVARQLSAIFDAYGSFRLNQERRRTDLAERDSLVYQRLRNSARLKLTSEQWRALLDSYLAGRPEFFGLNEVSREDARLHATMLSDAFNYARQLVAIGVLDVPLDTVRTSHITIRNEQSRVDRIRSKNNLLGLNDAFTNAQVYFQDRYNNSQRTSLALSFFRAVFVPSFEYMGHETQAEIQRKIERISPTQGAVQRGEPIVMTGQQVTPLIHQKLLSMNRAEQERGGSVFRVRTMVGELLVIIATYLLFFLYLYLLRRQVFDDNGKILMIAILFGLIAVLYALAMHIKMLQMYAVPVAIVSVLLTVMFDSRVGMWATMTLALIGGAILGYDFEYTFATLFAGMLGVFSVRDVRNRGQFFVSAGLVFTGYLLILFSSWLVFDSPVERFWQDVSMVGINAFLLISAYPILWVFERTFDITTDLTLLELSDTNRPLLKEFAIRAPGSFSHSLQVANLAEAAADAIGANALLTRVGALYHDIGKMLKPEYFVENQRLGENPHDALKPRMSSLIIASHVKEGIELGRQHRLPERVLEFIPMHHGTMRIEFFFRKAGEQRGTDEPPIQESEFRYPGPRPNSKEAGILMLADSVEATSRTLSDPTHKRLEAVIDMIFKARIEDNQLDDSDLTFRDLDVAKDAFLAILAGIYHTRLKYPRESAA